MVGVFIAINLKWEFDLIGSLYVLSIFFFPGFLPSAYLFYSYFLVNKNVNLVIKDDRIVYSTGIKSIVIYIDDIDFIEEYVNNDVIDKPFVTMSSLYEFFFLYFT